jgi:hypothetical protein
MRAVRWMSIEVAETEDDSLDVTVIRQKLIKRFIYLNHNTLQPTYKDASLQSKFAG